MSPKSEPSAHILVVDDEPDLRTLYELTLRKQGYQVTTAQDLLQARQQLKKSRFDVVLTDMRLPDGLGLELLRELHRQERTERCVVVTAHGCAQNAVDSLKAGAFDYLTKPVELKQFRAVIDSAVHSLNNHLLPPERLSPPPEPISTKASPGLGVDSLMSQTASMQNIKTRLIKVAGSMAPVLFEGESGTGKEFLARLLHNSSHRWEGPFVAVDCAEIVQGTLEAAFFGVRKEAYSNFTENKTGFFQQALGGTLFLNDVSSLPMAMQIKLLHAVQDRLVRPLGSPQEDAVDVRIVSATTKNLAELVASGQFRQDLYYRLNVVHILVPPLRERREDLPGLCRALLAKIAQAGVAPNAVIPELSNKLLEQLQHHQLPGNVCELENLLHRALALSEDGRLELEAQFDVSAPPLVAPQDLQTFLDEQERAILITTLEETRFNRTAAAARLGLSLRQMRYRIARLNIPMPTQDENHDQAQ